MDEFIRQKLMEVEGRVNGHERTLIELTAAIGNGMSADIRRIKECLDVLTESGNKQREQIATFKEFDWFMTWVNDSRNKVFQTLIKAVVFLGIIYFAICAVSQQGWEFLKSWFKLGS